MTGQAHRTDVLFAEVERTVEATLLPNAAAVDQSQQFPSGNVDAIAKLGLFGMVVPAEVGGLGLMPSEVRRLLRLLSSGCGATAFAFAQHHGATGAVAATTNTDRRDEWLPRLVDSTLAGTAFAHVRRRGEPVLRAEPDGEGWRLSGNAPWMTSWGHAEVMTVAASTDDDRLVWALLEAKDQPGLMVRKVFELMVFQATQTVALSFDSLRVEPDQVLSVVDVDAWARRDRLLSARPSPLCLGIGDRALAEMLLVDQTAAARVEPWWLEVGAAAESQCRIVDAAIAAREIDEALVAETAALRAATLLATQRLTTMLLAVAGGSAIERSHTAQRLAREALFYVIQAQSPDGKAATLAAASAANWPENFRL